jgi:hypothetical protein
LWRPGTDSALVWIYTISAFSRRGRPNSTFVGSRRLAPRRIEDWPPRAACAAALHRDESSRRFQRSPGLSHRRRRSEPRWFAFDLEVNDRRPSKEAWPESPSYRGSLVARQTPDLDVVARNRDLVSSFCLCAQRQTAGVSDNLTWRGRRDLGETPAPSSDCTLDV